MGFFQRLFGRGNTKAAKGARSPHSLTPWTQAGVDKTAVIEGDSPRTVYVYDSRPLHEVPDGGFVELDAFRGDATMQSVHTGTVSSTNDRTDTCLTYQGKPVGFVSLPLSQVQQAADAGFGLRVRCRVEGMLAGYTGVREVVAFLPSRFYSSNLIAQESASIAGVPAHAESVEYNEYDEADFQDLLSHDTWEFVDADLHYLPVPEGSKAKPHIEVVSSEGMTISRVTARNGSYRDLATAMDSEHFYVTARKWSRHDGQPAYRITVRHW